MFSRDDANLVPVLILEIFPKVNTPDIKPKTPRLVNMHDKHKVKKVVW